GAAAGDGQGVRGPAGTGPDEGHRRRAGAGRGAGPGTHHVGHDPALTGLMTPGLMTPPARALSPDRGRLRRTPSAPDRPAPPSKGATGPRGRWVGGSRRPPRPTHRRQPDGGDGSRLIRYSTRSPSTSTTVVTPASASSRQVWPIHDSASAWLANTSDGPATGAPSAPSYRQLHAIGVHPSRRH